MAQLAWNRVLAAGLLALVALGCGGGAAGQASSGGGSGSGSGTGSALSTPVQVTLGDAPGDWVMAFGMTVGSMTLTASGGSTVSLLPAATPVEMMQSMATTLPMAMIQVPQGTYTQATVTVGSVTVGYMDPSTGAYVQKTMAGPFTATIPFSPALSVGSAPVSLNVDMDMGASLSLDASGNLTLAPVMTATMPGLAASGQTPWTGSMPQLMGSISSVSGSSFTLASMMGLSGATFATNAATQFAGNGLSGIQGLSTGLLVNVAAVVQADGTYLATRVESLGIGSTGMLGGGLVTAVTGNPPTQLTLAAGMGQGGGMMPSSIGGALTVSLSSSTTFVLDDTGLDLTGLPFTPDFSAASLAKGQRVAALSPSGMMSGGGGMMGSLGTVSASALRLEPQSLHGTVSAYTASGGQATFTLTLPAGSAFATLTGTATVQVCQQAGTRLVGLPGVANGTDVAVRGLLFDDAGTYRLVAGWITPP